MLWCFPFSWRKSALQKAAVLYPREVLYGSGFISQKSTLGFELLRNLQKHRPQLDKLEETTQEKTSWVLQTGKGNIFWYFLSLKNQHKLPGKPNIYCKKSRSTEVILVEHNCKMCNVPIDDRCFRRLSNGQKKNNSINEVNMCASISFLRFLQCEGKRMLLVVFGPI